VRARVSCVFIYAKKREERDRLSGDQLTAFWM